VDVAWYFEHYPQEGQLAFILGYLEVLNDAHEYLAVGLLELEGVEFGVCGLEGCVEFAVFHKPPALCLLDQFVRVELLGVLEFVEPLPG